MAVKSITLGDILKFTLLPGILPRTRDLFGTGFGTFAYFIAVIYRAVRLLPAGHPFLNPANIGRYGMASVIREAGRHIYYNRFQLGQKNIDQIIVFVVVLAAILLMALQIITLFLALFMPQAMAYSFPNGASFSSPFAMFGTPDPVGTDLQQQQPFYDIAFMFLDRVFGIPGMFNSCISDAGSSCVGMNPMGGPDNNVSVNDPTTFPWPYHHALHGIFQFYSVGMLAVAVFMIVYYTIVVVAETAQTGTPFGKRFNTLWAPLRLVLAAGLLIPISYGLNAGQYTVLYAAKWGSNFATNGWIGFNQMISSSGSEATALGASTSLIATPKTPDVTPLLHFFSVYQACKTIEDTLLLPRTNIIAGETTQKSPKIHAYLVRSSNSTSGNNTAQANYLMIDDDGSAGPPASALTYEGAVRWSGMGDVVIRFGVQDQTYSDQMGTVKPFCGEITLPTIVAPQTSADAVSNGEVSFLHLGGATIMKNYWDMIVDLINVDTTGEQYNFGPSGGSAPNKNLYSGIALPYAQLYTYGDKPSATLTSPDFQIRNDLLTYFNTQLKAIIDEGVKAEQGNSTTPFALRGDFLMRGWAAAGVWYNRIAEVNGTITAAAWNMPVITHMPLTMETVAQAKQAVETNPVTAEMYNPYIQNQRMAIVFDRGNLEQDAADTYWQITKWWQEGGGGLNNGSTRGQKTGNVILDLINWLFGTSGLFSIRENSNVHPLAQLSSIGKGLIERSIALMGIGLGATFLEPMAQQIVGLKQITGVVSSMTFTMLSLGASAGFILFYVIPFLPFIYFFFAVAGWVKAIFEAMIGVPLWALAHIKIDGQSLPGDAAMSGYYLIAEIMLRPILIIFGLISSVTIYAASVQVLNDIFNLAVQNITGVDIDSTLNNSAITMENLRGSLDTFLYTIMYTIMVYMLGMSSFKMIDLIPGSMMRWMGANISPFTDSGEAHAGSLVQYGTMGSGMIFDKLGMAARQTIGGVGQIVKGGADMMMRGSK